MISTPLWILISLQVAMGAFDTLYHHEFTERLAWRPGQAQELKLHGVRNLLYAAFFLVIGWIELHGLWAALLCAVLAVELVITLADFVEEDRTRLLPASERVTHTLLTLNYGAVLALLMPLLLARTGEATGLAWTAHGVWSGLALAAAGGVAVFGVRDLLASRRAVGLAQPDPSRLAAALTGPRRRVLVTGATGFVGPRLVNALSAAGHEVTVLARDPAKAARVLAPPYRVVTDLAQLPDGERIDAVVNLAGEPISDGLWTLGKRRRILRSRLHATRDVLRLIARLEHGPEVLVSGSAVGWYGLRGDERLDETAEPRPCFSHRMCEAWEQAARGAEALGVRVVRLRLGLVLGTDGGMLARLLLPFEFGLGGPIGSGRQWMPWIAQGDAVRLIVHALATPALRGAVNATAPEPVCNAEFARELGRALGRPALLRAPGALLSRLGGAFADELLLGGQRVLPAKAIATGFRFDHPRLVGALAQMIPRPAPRRRACARPSGLTSGSAFGQPAGSSAA